jgi:hypothetical protein
MGHGRRRVFPATLKILKEATASVSFWLGRGLCCCAYAAAAAAVAAAASTAAAAVAGGLGNW